ncbi:hypothetical protein U1Q18_036551, partial [Sarracenia purpurea var. burkii]
WKKTTMEVRKRTSRCHITTGAPPVCAGREEWDITTAEVAKKKKKTTMDVHFLISSNFSIYALQFSDLCFSIPEYSICVLRFFRSVLC